MVSGYIFQLGQTKKTYFRPTHTTQREEGFTTKRYTYERNLGTKKSVPSLKKVACIKKEETSQPQMSKQLYPLFPQRLIYSYSSLSRNVHCIHGFRTIKPPDWQDGDIPTILS